jgi:hypothetical protein
LLCRLLKECGTCMFSGIMADFFPIQNGHLKWGPSQNTWSMVDGQWSLKWSITKWSMVDGPWSMVP